MDLKGRDLLKLLDFTSDEIRYMLATAHQFKKLKQEHKNHQYLQGKNIALLFEKTSTRTRCAFEVAAHDLGMHVTYLDPTGSQMGHKESIADTAKVLSRMFDGIEYRGFGQNIVEELAYNSKVPVWNGLTNEFHPTQMLADVMTLEENFGNVQGLKWAYMGDARNNVANSLMVVSAKLGMDFTICAPKELWPTPELIKTCQNLALENGAKLSFTEDPIAGTKGAKAIYTDIWVSMGEPKEKWEERINLLKPYQVNANIMQNAAPDAIFLHCLPSFHDFKTSTAKELKDEYNLECQEVTDDVFNSERSKVFDQAENRMHTIKAVMFLTLYEGRR